MSELLAKLTERQLFLSQQYQRKAGGDVPSDQSYGSASLTQEPSLVHHGRFDTDSSEETPITPASAKDMELERLKAELDKANSQLRQMNRDRKQCSPPVLQMPQLHGLGISETHEEPAFSVDHSRTHQAGWNAPGSASIWAPMQNHNENDMGPALTLSPAMTDFDYMHHPTQPSDGGMMRPPSPAISSQVHQRAMPNLRVNTMIYRNSEGLGRPNSALSSYGPVWGPIDHNSLSTPHTPMSFGPPQQPFSPLQPQAFNPAPGSNMNVPRPMPSRLSPTAMEFNASGPGMSAYSPWNPQPQQDAQPAYMSTTEPMNYRRLLDRNMSCNWKYIVDKIVCNNDQQASIFLQQKLKVGTQEQKYEIIQAIIDQACPLMTNRFGNFLVQRCFEHGTPEQIISIARAIRGNTLNLSMDAFGCHVVQKAFDSVPEEYKAIMVHELLRRIPETVIHRYACHVWQKLFELRWNGQPPQIMRYVNEALRGMWHEVALGETGSLVVQNIFENCLEDDKRPCINEVLAAIDVVAHGQFGNWCIQHICEHGSIPDRTRAIDHVIRFATEYSMDQFASKVVEKCLKISGNDFLDRYLDRVCEARVDRPRMPLIDVAGDQFGNYLIQWILTNADSQRREVVSAHIRKHMVSLRGSKYGSRVAMLCCNSAYATRPGPPSGMAPGRGGPGPGAWSERSSYTDRPYSGPRGSSYHAGY